MTKKQQNEIRDNILSKLVSPRGTSFFSPSCSDIYLIVNDLDEIYSEICLQNIIEHLSIPQLRYGSWMTMTQRAVQRIYRMLYASGIASHIKCINVDAGSMCPITIRLIFKRKSCPVKLMFNMLVENIYEPLFKHGNLKHYKLIYDTTKEEGI